MLLDGCYQIAACNCSAVLLKAFRDRFHNRLNKSLVGSFQPRFYKYLLPFPVGNTRFVIDRSFLFL